MQVSATIGATLFDQHDIAGVARIAPLRDLEGAAFGLWQAAPGGAALWLRGPVPAA